MKVNIRFQTSAARLAYTFDLSDIGKQVVDLENGAHYIVVASGSGAATHVALAPRYGILHFGMADWAEADGTALAAFADGASPTPGYALANSEAMGIRWNNHANPDPIGTTFVVPPDLDESADATLYFLASKIGATLGDAVTWTVQAFNQVDGALHDADADFGGASSAMTGDAATKTCQLESLTLATANLAAYPACVTLTVQPTDGTLGTDDVLLHACWLQYSRKVGASAS